MTSQVFAAPNHNASNGFTGARPGGLNRHAKNAGGLLTAECAGELMSVGPREQVERPAVPFDGELDRHPAANLHVDLQVVEVVDGLVVRARNPVAGQEAGAGSARHPEQPR